MSDIIYLRFTCESLMSNFALPMFGTLNFFSARAWPFLARSCLYSRHNSFLFLNSLKAIVGGTRMLNIVWGNINSKMHYGGKRSVLKPRETRTKKEKSIIVVKSIVAAQFLFHDTVAIHRTLPELRCAKRTTEHHG